MSNTKLHEFVTNAAARSRITFGDVRRLQRDYLPGGITTCDEAEMLIRLDGSVDRADKAWADWFVTVIVDFALFGEQPIDGVECGPRQRLKDFLAATGTSTKATRRIGREIRRQADQVDQADQADQVQQTIPLPANDDDASPEVVFSDHVMGTMNELELAA